MEQNNVHFENFAYINVDSDSVFTQEKPNRGEKYCQAITYGKNEANKSIEQNTSKKTEQNTSKTIEQNTSEKNDFTT